MKNLDKTTIQTIFILVIILYSTPLFPQFVGINTKTPNRLIHIDAQGNNTASVSDFSPLVSDDVIIDNTGNIGIGVLSPTAKIHIDSKENGVAIPGFKLVDGTQKAGRALMSDKDGFATWRPIDFSGYTVVDYQRVRSEFTNTQTTGTIVQYSNLYIDFPGPGNYLVSIGIKVEVYRNGSGTETIQGFLQPTNVPTDWGVKRFVGAYPVIASNTSGPLQNRIILTQQIQIPEGSTRAYLMLTFWNMQYTATGYIYTTWGNTDVPGEAQRTGGSYVRIN
ncbi:MULTISPECIES: hypothetical protein [unclassified Dysgonomonas]|uniref:hypothetical protein n=1 Tax=unclassified Dysgonomonas TaxID=2630389 RepID=UPI00067FD91E|nr:MULTISPECIES: hypothetical protein [unclassified Dysgonomonas]MBD8349463.1 hypothetical protein [Dysgonomonas sp. HGC4]MBF0577935.1 hypothetical protein [Dysgonomonas sp. GY617]